VSNVVPRTDVNGNIMDIHDGTTIRIGDTFFWYGAGYGNCTEMSSGCASIAVGACGFNLDHQVRFPLSPFPLSLRPLHRSGAEPFPQQSRPLL
jgi:hypothetical protein